VTRAGRRLSRVRRFTGLPGSGPIQATHAGEYDVFSRGWTRRGRVWVFGTPAGRAAGSDSANAIRWTRPERIYVAGLTLSGSFPFATARRSRERRGYEHSWRRIGTGVQRSGTLTAAPNPIQVCDDRGLAFRRCRGRREVSNSWRCESDPRPADLMSRAVPTGSATTGKWVV